MNTNGIQISQEPATGRLYYRDEVLDAYPEILNPQFKENPPCNSQPTKNGNKPSSGGTTTPAKSRTAARKRTSTRTTSKVAANAPTSAESCPTALPSAADTTTTSTTAETSGSGSSLSSPSHAVAPTTTAPESQNRVRTKWNPDYVLEYFKKVGIKDHCYPEFRFHPVRRWRFDYAFPDKKVYLEVDGGIFGFYVTNKTTGERKLVVGGHNYGGQIRNEHAKRNAATVMGWRGVWCEPKFLLGDMTLRILKEALGY